MSHARVLSILTPLALVACSSGSDLAGIDYTQFPLANGARLEKVAIYQGVEKVLYRANGVFADGSRPPPIVADREAIVRIHVAPEDPDTWVPHEVAVVLEYDDGSFSTQAPDVRLLDAEDWDQGDLATTSVVRIPAERINADMKLTVSLRETSGSAVAELPDAPQLWTSETDGLDVLDSDVITINIVPIKYTADGSGRLPDTSPETIAKLRNQFFAMYPARDVAVVVDKAVTWSNPITAFTGWEGLLTEMSRQRTTANVPENTYYYALFNPSDNFDAFCNRGCILGLSLLAQDPSDTWGRASMGLGYPDYINNTMVHEVGHAHGREHAPCSLYGQPSDPGYPYNGAQLGSWGFDIVNQTLIEPKDNRDMMGYCEPMWVSDYTFSALFDRISALRDDGVARASTQPVDWQMLTVYGDGNAELGGTVQASAMPGGDIVSFELLDSTGAVVDLTDGWFLPFDHLDGGIALVEPTRRSVASARLATR